MTFDSDLRERLQGATRSLPELPDTFDDVRRRGRRRRVATRVAGAGGLAIIVVAGAAVAVNLSRGPATPNIDPIQPPTQQATEGATTGEGDVVAPAEVGWPILTTGADGVQWWTDDGPRTLQDQPAVAAVALPDSMALVQAVIGDPVFIVGPEQFRQELVAARPELRLLGAGTAADGTFVGLVTWRTGDPAQETDEHLGTVDISSGEVTDLGVSGGIESGLDTVDLVDGQMLETGCHIQCALRERTLGEPLDDPRDPLVDGFLTAGAWFGDDLAYVAYEPDPADGSILSRELVVAGQRVPLPDVDGWPAVVSVAPDRSSVLVSLREPTSDAQTYLVDRLGEGTPRVRELSVFGVARFAAPDGTSPDAAAGSPCTDAEVSADVTGDGQPDGIGYDDQASDDGATLWVCPEGGERAEIPGVGQVETLQVVDADRDGRSEILFGATAATSLGVMVAVWDEGRLAIVDEVEGRGLLLWRGGVDEQFDFGCRERDGARFLVSAHAVPDGEDLAVTWTGYRIVGSVAQVAWQDDATRPHSTNPRDWSGLTDC